jgi:hypothetical protein
MLIPYKPKTLPIMRAKPKFIIIHDLTCMYHDIDQIKIDGKKSQTNIARTYNWVLNGQSDINYHFMVEKIGKDYETLIGRPINRLCQFDDIPDVYDTRAIHIACMGRYDTINADNRFYQQLAYRAIAPSMSTFGIPITNIYLHHEISNDKTITCPGPFFMKDKLMAKIKIMNAR